METTISAISILPCGKTEVDRFVKSFKSEILANYRDPLKVLVQLKYAEMTIKNILTDDEINNCFLNEAILYGKNDNIYINNANIRVQETGVKHDYSASGDPEWNDLDKEIESLTAKKKAREKFLISIPDEGTVDPKTGLYITRPPKSSKTKCVVTIK